VRTCRLDRSGNGSCPSVGAPYADDYFPDSTRYISVKSSKAEERELINFGDAIAQVVSHRQNYWVFGLCPSSGILETRKHDDSETGSVSVLR
jgi:hypothetical protein